MDFEALTNRQRARLENMCQIYASKVTEGDCSPYLDNSPCSVIVDRLADRGELLESLEWEWHNEAHSWFDALVFEGRMFLDLFHHARNSKDPICYREIGVIPSLENGTFVEYWLVVDDELDKDSEIQDFELLMGPRRYRNRPFWYDLAFVFRLGRSYVHANSGPPSSSMSVSMCLNGADMHRSIVAFLTDNEPEVTSLLEGVSAECHMDLPFDDIKTGPDPSNLVGFLNSYRDSSDMFDQVVSDPDGGGLDIGFEAEITVEGKPPTNGNSPEYKLLAFHDQFVRYVRRGYPASW